MAKFCFGWDGNEWQESLDYHLLDHLGSREVVCDATGSKKSGPDGEVKYSTFGEHEGGAEGEYSYTGKKKDDGTGLTYFNARYYDPAIGRFVTMDPIKDGMNWYVYCGNNPLRYVDVNGLINIFFLPYTPFSVSDSKDQTMIFLAINEAGKIANTNVEYFNNKISSIDNENDMIVATQIRDTFQSLSDFLKSDKTIIITQKDLGLGADGEGSLGPNAFFEQITISSNKNGVLANTNLDNVSALAKIILHELLHNIGKDHKSDDNYWDSPFNLVNIRDKYFLYIESNLFNYNDYNGQWYSPESWYKGTGGHGSETE